MKSIAVMVAVVGVVVAGCGSDDSLTEAVPGADEEATESATSDAPAEPGTESGTESDTESGTESGAESVGPAETNTIRIGSQVWERTLPMTTGQCFVQNVEGLPPSGVAWGTLDGDDGIRFSANQNQDGTNEAEVDDQESYYWLAGPRASGPDDLEIELDFDALTIVGQGTFTNLFTGETAPGSFAFQCEDDGSGG